MNKISSFNIQKILGLAAVLILVSIPAFAQDSDQGQTSSQQVTSFGNDAQRFADNLAQQLGATTGAADKITQALVDYRNSIAEARLLYLDKNKEMNKGAQSNTGGRDITGSQPGQNRGMAGNIDSDPSLLNEYRKADEEADKAIINALDNDAQKAKYIQIKKQWWKDVKDKVYSSVKQNPGADQDSGQ